MFLGDSVIMIGEVTLKRIYMTSIGNFQFLLSVKGVSHVLYLSISPADGKLGKLLWPREAKAQVNIMLTQVIALHLYSNCFLFQHLGFSYAPVTLCITSVYVTWLGILLAGILLPSSVVPI